jgi:hypothetical protein
VKTAIGLLTLALAIAAATPAAADPTPLRLIPPKEYDHPYKGNLVVHVADSQEDVRRLCPGPSSAGSGRSAAHISAKTGALSSWPRTTSSQKPGFRPSSSSATRSRTVTAGRRTTAVRRCLRIGPKKLPCARWSVRSLSRPSSVKSASWSSSRAARACLERATNPLHRAGIDPKLLSDLAHTWPSRNRESLPDALFQLRSYSRPSEPFPLALGPR